MIKYMYLLVKYFQDMICTLGFPLYLEIVQRHASYANVPPPPLTSSRSSVQCTKDINNVPVAFIDAICQKICILMYSHKHVFILIENHFPTKMYIQLMQRKKPNIFFPWLGHSHKTRLMLFLT